MSQNAKKRALRKKKKSLKDRCDSSFKFCSDRLSKFFPQDLRCRYFLHHVAGK